MPVVPNMSAQKAELMNRRAALIIIGLCFVAAHAGGLGVAPLAAIAGIIGLLTADVPDPKSHLQALF